MMSEPVRNHEFRASTVLAVVCFVVWLFYGAPIETLIFDPSFYYAHIRSPVIDGDLDFANEGLLPGPVTERTITGLAPSIWSAGPALVWAPFFLIAHALSLLGAALGFPLAADGYNPLYLTLSALGSVLAGWLGVLLCYLIARRSAGIGPSLLAAIGAWFGSVLFYYMYKNPFMAHAATVAAVGGVVYVWICIVDGNDSPGIWFLLGLLIGIAALMRWQNGLFVLLVPFAMRLERVRQYGIHGLVQRLGLGTAGMVLGFLPQIVVWWRLYGSPLAMPQGAGFLLWERPEIALVLFSTNRGLFVWQPLACVAWVGLAMYSFQRPRVGLALIGVTLLELYLNSVVLDWWGGGGFGPRRFDWMLPIQTLGCAYLFERVWRLRAARGLAVIVVAVLIVYELALAQAHFYRLLPLEQAFPIDDYDHGRPLSLAFFEQVVLGALRDPGFLVAFKPTMWSTIKPPIFQLADAVRGAGQPVQFVAAIMAMLLLGGVLAAGTTLLRRVFAGRLAPFAISQFVQYTSLVLCVWLAAASVVFLTTGPR